MQTARQIMQAVNPRHAGQIAPWMPVPASGIIFVFCILKRSKNESYLFPAKCKNASIYKCFRDHQKIKKWRSLA